MLQLDPTRAPTVPRDAATVVVLREARASVELFCVKRHARSGFLGGAVVFPGGKVAPGDHHLEWSEQTTELSARCRSLAGDLAVARAFAVAALRESLEEAAILPVAQRSFDDAATLELRSALSARAPTAAEDPDAFRRLLAERGLKLDCARLEALSRWVTPAAEERRYDTRFYVLGIPEGQTGRHDDHETTNSFWASADRLFEMWERSEIFLAPPTIRTIQLFEPVHTLSQAYEVARRQALDPVCPFFVMDGQTPVLALPGDPLHPELSSVAAPADGPTRFVMHDGRFVPMRVG